MGQDFLELETPLRIPSPAPEEHIEAIRSEDWFLQTSPELCMKRLLAAGYPRIFQIAKCFRFGERGRWHLPEFTMLEWYATGSDYQTLMRQCEQLISFVANDLENEPFINPREVNFLQPPWNCMTVEDAFAKYSPSSLEEAITQNKFDLFLVDYIEPRLGREKPTFLYDYPAHCAALAKLQEADPTVAERFELYINGLEIANGFSELTDAQEQRRRFEDVLKKRADKNWTRYSMPEKFLQSLDTILPCAGIALGIDRLVMVLTDAANMDDVVTFVPEDL